MRKAGQNWRCVERKLDIHYFIWTFTKHTPELGARTTPEWLDGQENATETTRKMNAKPVIAFAKQRKEKDKEKEALSVAP
ncbi:hypothetical protein AVEN_72734-1 [Araneus ventricosus]|uniref:Uncharacterized protein n=1 Tax=Araneus ventricosus TaxID=182803 RepID=A0A4Y2DNN0_ARAVE|nr:hypothetical protein AVEN_72734-1 [Araneus ventricosus]